MVPQSEEHRRVGPYLSVVVGVLVASQAALLIRLAQTQVNSLAVAAWRLTLATLVIAPIALVARRSELRQLSRRDLGKVLAAGLLLAVHFAGWITSLAYTSVAASTVLVWTSPTFVGLGSHLLLRERLAPGIMVALVTTIAGGILIAVGDLGQGSHRLLGDLMALVGALALAGYLLIGRRLRPRLSLIAYIFPVYGIAALALMAALLASGLPGTPRHPQGWLWLALLALGPQVLGHSSLNYALRFFSATFVNIASFAEPVIATLLAWWVLGEAPSSWIVGGGVLIFAGIAVATLAERPVQAMPQKDVA